MDHTYNLTLSKEFLNRVIAGLGELQTKFGMPVVHEIEKQLAAQEANAQPAQESANDPGVQAAV